MKSSNLERVAETHYFVRPQIEKVLKKTILSDEGQKIRPDCQTYYDVWIAHKSDKFLDCSTLIRTAASVECALRDFYLVKKRYLNLKQLRQDINYKKNIFQRILPWQKKGGAIELFKTINVDLNLIPELFDVQELMLHRHLYAHNLGIVDDDYIQNLKKLTSEDLMTNPHIAKFYPEEDVYWFEPLERLPIFIEKSRSFLNKLV